MNNVANHGTTPRLFCEPLAISHLDELAEILLHPQVYAYLGEPPPSVEVFKLGLSRALQGPGLAAAGQMWLNYLVRSADSGEMLGRLEATVHDGLAEVAFLFAPEHWGRGLATEGLHWLHGEIARVSGVSAFWATTVAQNTHCQALLGRCGYVAAQLPACGLLSYDAGDLVFELRGGSRPAVGGCASSVGGKQSIDHVFQAL
jgi:RimJ/RimL family protein N-acetyltransferase